MIRNGNDAFAINSVIDCQLGSGRWPAAEAVAFHRALHDAGRQQSASERMRTCAVDRNRSIAAACSLKWLIPGAATLRSGKIESRFLRCAQPQRNRADDRSVTKRFRASRPSNRRGSPAAASPAWRAWRSSRHCRGVAEIHIVRSLEGRTQQIPTPFAAIAGSPDFRAAQAAHRSTPRSPPARRSISDCSASSASKPETSSGPCAATSASRIGWSASQFGALGASSATPSRPSKEFRAFAAVAAISRACSKLYERCLATKTGAVCPTARNASTTSLKIAARG